MSFGEKIKALRLSQGMTQAEMAEKLDVATITVRQWENRKRVPNIKRVKSIADAFGIATYELLDAEDYPSYIQSFDIPSVVLWEAVADEMGIPISTVSAVLNHPEEKKEAFEKILRVAVMLLHELKDTAYLDEKIKIYEAYKNAMSYLSFANSENESSDTTEEVVKLLSLFAALNDEGKEKALERIEELTELPRYSRQED